MSDNNKSAPATKADLLDLATKADLKNLELATKADLKSLESATKADLKSLELATNAGLKSLESATKADLKNLELTTQAEIKKLATKDELKGVEQKLTGRIDSVEATVKNIAVELTKTQADVRDIKHDIATKMATRDDISRLMNHIDAFAAEALSHRNHDTLRGRAIMDHTEKLKDHENRLQKLEVN